MEKSEDLYLAPEHFSRPMTLRQSTAKISSPFPGINSPSVAQLVGVVMVGNPRDPELNDGQTLAVLHICAIGGRTAYGMLYEAARIMKHPVWLMDIGLRHLTDPSRVYPVLHLLNTNYANIGEMGRDALLYVHQAGHVEALAKEDLDLHRNDRLEANVL